MRTTSAYGNARLKKIDTERIRRELDDRKIVIVTGFQGVNKYDDYTTLGRGGSDTTAVALAAVLHADACEIYTDVDGVYTCLLYTSYHEAYHMQCLLFSSGNIVPRPSLLYRKKPWHYLDFP